MINIAIRATYYIFCCRNRSWDSPDLMQFWFLFFSFFFWIIQSQAAFIRSEIYNCTFKNTNKISIIMMIDYSQKFFNIWLLFISNIINLYYQLLSNTIINFINWTLRAQGCTSRFEYQLFSRCLHVLENDKQTWHLPRRPLTFGWWFEMHEFRSFS